MGFYTSEDPSSAGGQEKFSHKTPYDSVGEKLRDACLLTMPHGTASGFVISADESV